MRETERRTVNVFAVPYDSGRREVRMGRGPEALLSGGLEGALRAPGRKIGLDAIEATGSFQAENATAFELMRLVSDRVREAAGSGSFPLVLPPGPLRQLQRLRGDSGGSRSRAGRCRVVRRPRGL